jgi:hypothetical protein
MDMAPRRNEWLASGIGPTVAQPGLDACPSRRALDTLQGATQAAMMMAMVWPLVMAMPVFWMPPLWVTAGIRGR